MLQAWSLQHFLEEEMVIKPLCCELMWLTELVGGMFAVPWPWLPEYTANRGEEMELRVHGFR